MALDTKLRAKRARAERFKNYDLKRKNLVEELEEREKALKKAKVDERQERVRKEQETERIKDLGRQMRERKEQEMRERNAQPEDEEEEEEEPQLGMVNAPCYMTLISCVQATPIPQSGSNTHSRIDRIWSPEMLSQLSSLLLGPRRISYFR
jgi:hypothetical protein